MEVQSSLNPVGLGYRLDVLIFDWQLQHTEPPVL